MEHLSVNMIFKSLWFLWWFPWLRIDANMEVTKPRVLKGFRWSLYFKSCTVTTRITEYLCWSWMCSIWLNHNPVLFSCMTYQRVCYTSNRDATNGAGVTCCTRVHHRFCRVHDAQSLVFCVVFCRTFFCHFSFGHCIVCPSLI